VNPIGRLEDAIIEDYQNEQRDPANSSLIPNVNLDERVDLLHMVLGLPQKKGTIEESIYRPTKVTEGDEDTVYYRSKAEEEDIVKALTGEDLGPSVNKYLSQNSSFDRWLKVKRSEHLGEISKEEATRRMGGLTSPLYGKTLGNYTLDYSVDEDGREYVSYYDKWNINPTEGKIGDDWIDTALSLNPPELYGRVYLDELNLGDERIEEKYSDEQSRYHAEKTKPKSSYYGQEFAKGGMLNY